jgi:iron complex transport system substrate-binding protein
MRVLGRCASAYFGAYLWRKMTIQNGKLICRVFIVIGLIAFSGCGMPKSTEFSVPHRIVSCAPSITEILFALGLGDKVVGVTKYCSFPPQARSIDKIGGYSDANLEKIAGLKPDLVVLLRDHIKQRTCLESYGIRTLAVDNGTCAGICSSFVIIGKACNASPAADSLVRLFSRELRVDSNGNSRPKVLFCVGRDSPGAGKIRSVYAAGRTTFYNDILLAAGCKNAFNDSVPAYPKLSEEGITAAAPDIIIDITPATGDYSCGALEKDWRSLKMTPAVKFNHIYCLSADYATVPGPRILLLLGDIRRIVTLSTTQGRVR